MYGQTPWGDEMKAPDTASKRKTRRDRETGAELSENWDPRQLRRSFHTIYGCKDFGRIGYAGSSLCGVKRLTGW